jgi:DNA repair protein RadA/Sms
MPKRQTKYVCRECGYEASGWLGRCPECGNWGSLDETVTAMEPPAEGGAPSSRTRGGRTRGEQAGQQLRALVAARGGTASPVLPITELPTETGIRQPTGLAELDLVLGGGQVTGSCILLAGDPGVGKSTLLLGVAGSLAAMGCTVLYVTGEESAAQIRLRAQRVGALSPRLLILAETDALAAVAAAHEYRPAVMIVDSIQTLYHPDVASPPGSVAQVRECAAMLVDVAKGLPTTVWLVGHVTKEGNVAGPRVLEHMVDVVLQFEGDRSYPYRILRGLKNRYGPTDEIGIFEMNEQGLNEVANPSQLFLSEEPGAPADRAGRAVPGTAVAAAIEGRRVILAEVQALVVSSPWGAPRRTAMGVDGSRLALIIAVLERRAGLKLHDKDIYVKVAGGVKLVEPGVDLAIALAIASAQLDRRVRPGTAVAGEIGLGGEVRQVGRVEQRLREAVKLGFVQLLARAPSGSGADGLLNVRTLGEALSAGLEPPKGARV